MAGEKVMTCPGPGLDLNAKIYARGVIPNKLSELENDVPYVSEEELYKVLGIQKGESTEPLLLSLAESLDADQKAQLKTTLGITDFVAEAVPSGSIPW